MSILTSSKLRAPAAAFVAPAILAGCEKKDLPPKGIAGSLYKPFMPFWLLEQATSQALSRAHN